MLLRILIVTLCIVVTYVIMVAFKPKEQYTINITKLDNKLEQTLNKPKDVVPSLNMQSEVRTSNVSVPKVEENNALVNPMSMLTKYHGEFSLDLHQLSYIDVGSVINIFTPYGDYEVNIDSIYEDHGKTVVTFGDEGYVQGLVIYSPEHGDSFVMFDSKDLSFETQLDSNGVGSFVNQMEYLKEGDRQSADDQIVIDEDDMDEEKNK